MSFLDDLKEPISTEYLKRQTIELTLQPYGCETCISEHVMREGSMQMLEWMTERNPTKSFMRWAARWYCPAALHQTIEVPLTWWDHLKREHAPKWFLKRWPWNKRVYQIYEMFPEIAWPKHSGHKMNVAILSDGACVTGPDIVQHPPLGELWGCLVSAVCAKCRRDLYVAVPTNDLASPSECLSEALRQAFLWHQIRNECKP